MPFKHFGVTGNNIPLEEMVLKEMAKSFRRDGAIVIEGLLTQDDCNRAINRMSCILKEQDWSDQQVIFSTTRHSHAQQTYFLESSDKVRFFFEEDAFSPEGVLVRPPEKSLNKVGHALHDLDPVFNSLSRKPVFGQIAKAFGRREPLIVQSMFIFKQPRIGGEVVCHQDATFLWTEPQSVLGIWIALEEATVKNGCLWGIPGSHTGRAPRMRFERMNKNLDKQSTQMVTLDPRPFDMDLCEPIEVGKGSVVIFDGLFAHMSHANRSGKSRHAYVIHVIDGTAHYASHNWLQRPHMPLEGFPV